MCTLAYPGPHAGQALECCELFPVVRNWTWSKRQKKSLCHIMSAALPKSIPDIPFCGILDDSMILFAFVSVSPHLGTQFLKFIIWNPQLLSKTCDIIRCHMADGIVPKPLLQLAGCQGVNRWHRCSHGEANGRQQEGRFSDGFQSASSDNIIKRYQQVSGIAAEEEKVYWAGCRSAEDEMDPYNIWKPWYLWI